MSAPRRRSGPPDIVPYLVLAGLGLLVSVSVSVWGAAHLAHSLSDEPAPTSANPVTHLIQVTTGQAERPGTTSLVLLGAEAALLTAAGAIVWRRRSRHGGRRTRVDVAARHLAKRHDLQPFTRAGAAATAKRLGAKTSSPGVRVGRVIGTGADFYGSWEDMQVDIWGPRTGKALATGTPVLTPHGWVPIKELARGCRVIGRDGQPTTVTGVFPQGVRPAYRVWFSDGASVLCDADHLWTVRPKIRADKKTPLAWRTWTTRQLLDRGLKRASGGARYYMPIVEPVCFEGVLPEGRPYGDETPPEHRGRERRAVSRRDPLSVPPYLLGVLLGDGGLTGGSIRLSTAEADDLLPLLNPLLPSGVTAKPVKGRAYDWALTVAGAGTRTNPLLQALRDLGVMGCSSLAKFVPRPYLLASPQQRLDLLRGLMDTDGSIDAAGHLELSTSSPQLADDVVFLVQSLGGLATKVTRETSHALSHRIHIRLPAHVEPFRLSRKADRWRTTREAARIRTPVRTITAIEPEGEAEMVCISVAAGDGLFVVNDFVVTHNTTSRAIPAILEAPGAVLVTSNKRDVVDATRLPREDAGDVWVFDPQNVVGEEPAWWWNPLSYVTNVDYATRMAAVFAAYSRDPGAKTDSYFDPEGEALLAWMLLAAAEAGEPITTVYRWLSDVTEATPVDILRRAGHELPAEHVQGVINYPDKQRGGIYGTARKSVGCLVNPAVTRWVTPDPNNPDRPRFDPHTFVRNGGTLYSLSREGQGTAGPLVTGLTVATIEAAEQYATSSPSGRLPVPMLGVLDEAANVCRWKDLPDLYSHYGSRGIVLMTILQSWAQGVQVWGEHGMPKLWSAANVRVYGGGVSDPKFLSDLVQLIGQYEPTTYSTTVQSGRGQHSRSTSASTRQEQILEVGDLFAMPRGRALVLPSGAPPVLIRTLPWQNSEHAAAVKASLAKYAPSNDLPHYTLEKTTDDDQ